MSVASSVIAIVIIIILIYIIVRIVRRKQYSGSVSAANVQQVIPASDLQSSSTGTTTECTYSIWIYIENWNTNYGQKKVIFERGLGTTGAAAIPTFQLYLDEYGNNLVAKMALIKNKMGPYNYYIGNYINPPDGYLSSMPITPTTELDKIKKTCDEKCNSMESCLAYNYGKNVEACYFVGQQPDNDLKTYFTPLEGDFAAIKKDTNYHTCSIPRVPTQQWVNVVVSISTSSVDIYVDGKLQKTCVTNGQMQVIPNTNIYISPKGQGFQGWNSRFKYWTKYMTPQQVWNIYRQGYGNNFNLGNYKLTLGVYNGDVEKSSITI